MRTILLLYLFMFVAFFDLHAQYPILSPFALSIGAAPSFIGLILGIYALTHLPGNLLAGYGIDRYGSKRFIAFSLIGAGIVLLVQANVTTPWQLMAVRAVSGFVLAFLSPACLALLAKSARTSINQGRVMAGNGLVHTLAAVVSPAVGAYMAAKLGYVQTFTFLGIALICIGLLSIIGIREERNSADGAAPHHKEELPLANSGSRPVIPWLFYFIPLSISCSQGILFFELPLMPAVQQSVMASGILFSLVSLGAMITLSMLFLNRYSSFVRTAGGCLGLAVTFYGMSIGWPVPLAVSLVLIGMGKGVIYPAMATMLANMAAPGQYGRVFSIFSISFSVGSFLGPVLAGQLREQISPYFLAFLALMAALLLFWPKNYQAVSMPKA